MTSAPHILDNPVFNSLMTKQKHFAMGTDLAKHYHFDVLRAVSLVNNSEAALRDLAEVVPKGETVYLLTPFTDLDLSGWTVSGGGAVVQMVNDQPVLEREHEVEILDLGEDDVPEMLHLVDLTRPGPFGPRTIETGHYTGIREQGQLIAMAGERMHMPGYREVSAVCTHPDHQGKGYARLLVSRLVNAHWPRNEVPFLHAWPDNAPAIGLYERMHFRIRTELQALVISH